VNHHRLIHSGVVNAARTVGVVNAARTVGVVNAARTVGVVNAARTVGVVNAAPTFFVPIHYRTQALADYSAHPY
jgi:hypothetical protein